jgi:poly(A) polymerase
MFSGSKPLEFGFVQRGQWIVAPATVLDAFSPIRAARLCASLKRKLESRMDVLLREIVRSEPLELALQRQEFTRLMLGAYPVHGLRALEQIGWLEHHMPALAACRGVEQFGGLHHLDVLDHSFEALERLITTFPDANLETRLATLLHDVGKPASRTWDVLRERWSFFSHDQVGARLVREMLEGFGFEAGLIERVALMVDCHMLRLPGDDRQAARFARRNARILPQLLQVMLADREAARGPLSGETGRLEYQRGMNLVLGALEAHATPAPLMDGREVMQFLGLEPGPIVGQAIAFLRDAAMSGDVTTLEQAQTVLRAWADARGLKRQNTPS